MVRGTRSSASSPANRSRSAARRDARSNARGCLYALREACRVKGMSLKGARVAVHGFGNAGANIARLVAKTARKSWRVRLESRSLFDSGIDVAAALKHKARRSRWRADGTKEMDRTT
jgi:glutamate dehydrogenase (NAD(P)+)